MKLRINKIISLILVIFVIIFTVGCEENQNLNNFNPIKPKPGEKIKKISQEFFFSRKDKKELQIFFLDVDNLTHSSRTNFTHTNVRSAGLDEKEPSKISKAVNSVESYIIKYGDVEILVDAGYQSPASNAKSIEENVKNNLLNKIDQICTDGVIEYLIVTHPDVDHIKSLIVEGGIFDIFLKDHKRKILNIIDFNSGLVALHSYEEIPSEKRLVQTKSYQEYCQKIRRLKKEKNTNYLPASALFPKNKIGESKKIFRQKSTVDLSAPQSMEEYVELFNAIPQEHTKNGRILTEYKANEAAKNFLYLTHKNHDFEKNVEKLGGSLKFELEKSDNILISQEANSKRYYYSINLSNDQNDNTELRILYNWYYDYVYHGSFSNPKGGTAVNNISVLIQVVHKNFKFMGSGDMGGNVESGLIKYYGKTDILKNVTVYKASHHGSTNNGENSKELFSLITPKVVVVTGCAHPNNKDIGDSAAFTSQNFYDNLYQGLLGTDIVPLILYTNIASYDEKDSRYYSYPFHGDIYITSYKNEKFLVDCIYKGNIKGFIKRNLTSKKHENIMFRSVVSNKVLSVHQTEWFKKAGFKYGGN